LHCSFARLARLLLQLGNSMPMGNNWTLAMLVETIYYEFPKFCNIEMKRVISIKNMNYE
jgi:hypothetical protein